MWLKKSLDGLKQSPRACYRKFTKTVIKHVFKQTQSDSTLFIKLDETGRLTILIVYVDDIILTRNDLQDLKLIK